MYFGTKEYAKDARQAVSDGYGVMVTQDIAVIREASFFPDKKGRKTWCLRVVHLETGVTLGIQTTPAGAKMYAISDTNEREVIVSTKARNKGVR